MLSSPQCEPALPSLASLGDDLLLTTPKQRWLARIGRCLFSERFFWKAAMPIA